MSTSIASPIKSSIATFNFWRRWLVVSAGLTLLFGAVMVIAPAFIHGLFSWIIYGEPFRTREFGNEAARYIGLIHGILGAVITAWGAMMLAVLFTSLRQPDRHAWVLFACSLFAWFIADTTYSLLTGFWQNAVFNVLFLVLFAPGLIGTWKYCRKA